MATPYLSLLSKRSISEQIQRYYDQSNLIYNIEDIVKAQSSDYSKTLKEVSREQAETIRAGTAAICGTLEEGFAMVSDGLQGVENAIYQLTDTLDTHLKMMIDEQRYNNILSENITLLLKVSDSQKERQANILKGLKFFNDSLRDPSMFDYSLKFLKKAEEDDDTDYFVLDKIGLIHLCSKNKNYDEAIKYFTKAVKFSKLDTHPSSIRLANILVGDITKPLQKQNATIDYIKHLTAQSLLWISIAYYEQAKFSEAIKFAQEAFQFAPTFLDAGFHLAKTFAANNQSTLAAEVLYQVIQQNSNFSLKTLSDIDLAPKVEIKETLEKLRQEVFNDASSRMNKCKSKILIHSKGNELLNKIERLINQKSFLACKKAIELLENKNEYKFTETIKKESYYSIDPKKEEPHYSIDPKNFSFLLEELIEYEIFLKQNLQIVKSIINNEYAQRNFFSKLISIERDLKLANSDFKSSSNLCRDSWENIKYGIIFIIIGFILICFGNTKDIANIFIGALGIICIIISLFLTSVRFEIYIPQRRKLMKHDIDKSKLENEEQNMRSNISQLENEVKQLEKEVKQSEKFITT